MSVWQRLMYKSLRRNLSHQEINGMYRTDSGACLIIYRHPYIEQLKVLNETICQIEGVLSYN